MFIHKKLGRLSYIHSIDTMQFFKKNVKYCCDLISSAFQDMLSENKQGEKNRLAHYLLYVYVYMCVYTHMYICFFCIKRHQKNEKMNLAPYWSMNTKIQGVEKSVRFFGEYLLIIVLLELFHHVKILHIQNIR